MKKRLQILTYSILLLCSSGLIAAYNDLDILPSQIVPPLDSDLISGDSDGILPEQTEPVREGKLLYDNHCIVCHDSTVHIREKRRVRSIGDIHYWVRRWSASLELDWSESQIEQVVHYLNRRFYRFPDNNSSNK